MQARLAVSKERVREILQDIKDGNCGHEDHADKIVVVEHEAKNFIEPSPPTHGSGHYQVEQVLCCVTMRD